MPIPEIVAIVCLVYAALYIVFALLVSVGSRRIKTHDLPDELPRVSVIVCARNEERDIERCLTHLAALDYPADKLELIIVDDESEDGTAAILQEIASKDDSFIILNSKDATTTLPAKQRPLDMGIHHAKGEFILTTDADIAVKPGWVKAHLAAYDDSVGIAGGITRIDSSSGRIFDRLINIDQVSKLAVSMGCVGLGVPFTVMGNNLSFRKKCYISCGGFEGFAESIVEDMALMNAIVRETDYSVGWATGTDSVALSAPEESLDALLNQRRRWLQELGTLSLTGKMLIGFEFLMGMVFLMMLFLSPMLPKQFLAVAMAWTAGYIFFMSPLPGREKNDIAWIPLLILFQLYYSAVFVLKELTSEKSVVWKGRVYKNE